MTQPSARRELHVVAGALFDATGRVLIAQRPAGKHMAGRWELPGGKLEPGETPLDALRRELAEELGVTLANAERLIRLRHDYAGPAGVSRRLAGDCLRGRAARPRRPGAAVGAAGQPAGNRHARSRPAHRHRPAPALRGARGGRHRGPRPRSGGRPAARLLWSPESGDARAAAARAAVAAARAAGHRVLVVGSEVEAVTMAAITGADGVALQWSGEQLAVDLRGLFLAGVLCDSAARAAAAARAGAQFVIVAPPAAPLDGATLAQLCELAGVPVLAGWYHGLEALPRVRAAGAHGCAIGERTRKE
jgi:8-oxo-dGTP diphosphatase